MPGALTFFFFWRGKKAELTRREVVFNFAGASTDKSTLGRRPSRRG